MSGAPASSAQSAVARRASGAADSLQELLTRTLWPLVEAAFRDVEDHVEARFFQFDDLQVVVSRAPVRGTVRRDTERRVTLEVWPLAGPRLLEVEWSGSRPYVVQRRKGDWLERLARSSRPSE